MVGVRHAQFGEDLIETTLPSGLGFRVRRFAGRQEKGRGRRSRRSPTRCREVKHIARVESASLT